MKLCEPAKTVGGIDGGRGESGEQLFKGADYCHQHENDKAGVRLPWVMKSWRKLGEEDMDMVYNETS